MGAYLRTWVHGTKGISIGQQLRKISRTNPLGVEWLGQQVVGLEVGRVEEPQHLRLSKRLGTRCL